MNRIVNIEREYLCPKCGKFCVWHRTLEAINTYCYFCGSKVKLTGKQRIMREKLILSKEEAREIVYGDNENFVEISNELVDNSRWSNIYDIVVQRKSDGKYFKDSYSTGATEVQDESPYEYTDPDFTEVFKTEKTITVYE